MIGHKDIECIVKTTYSSMNLQHLNVNHNINHLSKSISSSNSVVNPSKPLHSDQIPSFYCH